MARELTPGEMVQARAIAPFELEALLKDWSADAFQWAIDHGVQPRDQALLEMHDGAGPPWPVETDTARTYAQRMAVAIFTLIKEI